MLDRYRCDRRSTRVVYNTCLLLQIRSNDRILLYEFIYCDPMGSRDPSTRAAEIVPGKKDVVSAHLISNYDQTGQISRQLTLLPALPWYSIDRYIRS